MSLEQSGAKKIAVDYPANAPYQATITPLLAFFTKFLVQIISKVKYFVNTHPKLPPFPQNENIIIIIQFAIWIMSSPNQHKFTSTYGTYEQTLHETCILENVQFVLYGETA